VKVIDGQVTQGRRMDRTDRSWRGAVRSLSATRDLQHTRIEIAHVAPFLAVGPELGVMRIDVGIDDGVKVR
jgi:hypothetical protein